MESFRRKMDHFSELNDVELPRGPGNDAFFEIVDVCEKFGGEGCGGVEKLDLLSCELEGYRGPSCSQEEEAKVDNGIAAEFDEKGKCVGIELGDDEGVLDEKDDEARLQMVVVEYESGMDSDLVLGKIEVECLTIIDDDEKISVKHEQVVGLSPKNVVDEVLGFHSDKVVPSSDKHVDLSKIQVEPSSANVDERFSDKDGNRIVLSPKNVVKEILSFGSDNTIPFSAEDDHEKMGVEEAVSSDKRKREDEKQVISLVGSDAIVSTETDVEKVGSSRKRTRVDESSALSEMVNWVANAARNPHDLAIGTLPHGSKWKEYGSDEIWKRALLARKALFVKWDDNVEKERLVLQRKKKQINPAMYADDKIPSVRCSPRVTSVKLCSCPGCSSVSSYRGKRHKAKVSRTLVHRDAHGKFKKVAVIREGPGYQAYVPEWTDVVSDSDPKWLGTPMWPPVEDDDKHETDLMVVGKGRESSCDCQVPGSPACVRFHVSENRMKLDQALGPLFHTWGFNEMGEEVSLSWTWEEEKEFKNLIAKVNQDLAKKTCSIQEVTSRFWRRASESLPTKTKAQFVSYYFNVFVLRRRRYQNTFTPEDVDSDDNETEKIHSPTTMVCLENKQCTELDFD